MDHQQHPSWVCRKFLRFPSLFCSFSKRTNIRDTWIEDLGLVTQWGRGTLGIPHCRLDGIWLNGQVLLESVIVQGFLSGIVWNTSASVSFNCNPLSPVIKGLKTKKKTYQLALLPAVFSNNFYGVYGANSGGDNAVIASALDGNTMASVGIPATKWTHSPRAGSLHRDSQLATHAMVAGEQPNNTPIGTLSHPLGSEARRPTIPHAQPFLTLPQPWNQHTSIGR